MASGEFPMNPSKKLLKGFIMYHRKNGLPMNDESANSQYTTHHPFKKHRSINQSIN